ncbi:MAG: hypothetical protein Q8O67_28050 [Deltaproteobacteria bacterium]|nr:hypothetical protein [Deltaproteobacteria bacterium]
MQRFVVVVVLFSGLARAGYFMEHEAILPNPATLQPIKSSVKSWHEGKRFKRETPMRNEVVIIDLESRVVTGINPTAKTYWKLPADRYRQLALLSLIVMGIQPKPDGSIDVPDPLFVATGQKAVIEGRNAYQVKVQGKLPQGVETEVWLSEEVPLTTEKLVDELRLALGDPKDPSYELFFNQWRELKGYPIQNVTTIMTPKGRVTTSETLLTFREMKIDASEFTVPKGYALTEDPITMMERMAAAMKGPVGVGAPLKANKPQVPGTLPVADPKQ